MSKLILDSLEIRRFRGFQRLRISQLGRVNLIVGKNNVGKSSLLEALKIYANRGFPTFVWDILESHDESLLSPRRSMAVDIEEALSSLKYLFYGRQDIKAPPDPIQIGPINSSEETLSINIGFFSSKVDEEGKRIIQPLLFEESDSIENVRLRLSIQLGTKINTFYPLDTNRYIHTEIKGINCQVANSSGLDKREIGNLWDKIALTDREKEVLSALRIIAPGVEDISIVGDSSSLRDRYTIIKVIGDREPLPIRSLGDGMQRMLGISLAIVNAEHGMLLIDEIENGLHYSVQTALWRLIFQISRRLNVQVFATSHSWDCIEAFQKASQENQYDEGVLIRLENKKGQVNATVFDKRKLEIATREQIEVR